MDTTVAVPVATTAAESERVLWLCPHRTLSLADVQKLQSCHPPDARQGYREKLTPCSSRKCRELLSHEYFLDVGPPRFGSRSMYYGIGTTLRCVKLAPTRSPEVAIAKIASEYTLYRVLHGAPIQLCPHFHLGHHSIDALYSRHCDTQRLISKGRCRCSSPRQDYDLHYLDAHTACCRVCLREKYVSMFRFSPSRSMPLSNQMITDQHRSESTSKRIPVLNFQLFRSFKAADTGGRDWARYTQPSARLQSTNDAWRRWTIDRDETVCSRVMARSPLFEILLSRAGFHMGICIRKAIGKYRSRFDAKAPSEVKESEKGSSSNDVKSRSAELLERLRFEKRQRQDDNTVRLIWSLTADSAEDICA